MKSKISWLNELVDQAETRTPEDAEMLLYEDAFCQWLREHAKGQDIGEFFAHLETTVFHTANNVDELFAALGW
jgi:hypothetical protein